MGTVRKAEKYYAISKIEPDFKRLTTQKNCLHVQISIVLPPISYRKQMKM